MEKPWGTDADTVAELASLAAARGAWVTAPFMTRYSFRAVTVKHMIEAGSSTGSHTSSSARSGRRCGAMSNVIRPAWPSDHKPVATLS